VERRRQRKFGLQQLHTATGGHRADGSVMTADVVWTACRTNVVGLQPGSVEPCRSVNDRRLSPVLNSLRGFQPVETGECVGDVIRVSQAGNESKVDRF